METTQWQTVEMDVATVEKEEIFVESSGYSSLMGLLPMFILIAIVFLRISWVLYRGSIGQKTRSQQQRRGYVGSRSRPSVQAEPTIFVSPNNLPPPPKYEALAPPSYEEVMSVTYPAFQGSQPQPIAYPIVHAVAQTSQNSPNSPNTTAAEEVSPSTVITVTADERRTSVTVATS